MMYLNQETINLNTASVASCREAQLAARCITVIPAKMDAACNLLMQLDGGLAVLPASQCDLTARADGSNAYCVAGKYLNRPVQCRVAGNIDYQGQNAVLLEHISVQRDYLRKLQADGAGTVVDATITTLAPYGAFCELGQGVSALLPIGSISVNRLKHPSDMLAIGQHIKAVMQSVSADGRVVLSMRELLGTWEENCSGLREGDTVPGIVRVRESYGVFIQLGGNLAALTNAPQGFLHYGDAVIAHINKIDATRMKVKVSVRTAYGEGFQHPTYPYYLPDGGRLENWRYSPAVCGHIIETNFGEMQLSASTSA